MYIKTKIENLIRDSLKNLNIEVSDIILEHPADLKLGDYSTNVAMAIAKSVQTNPKELAHKMVTEIERLNLDKYIEKIEVAGTGFINFYLSRKFFANSVEEILNNKDFAKNNIFSGKKIMIEYTDPNPFKPFHIGHLMTNAIGESLARILDHSGATVSRANYQGDVGLHVAKAIYILLKNPKEYIQKGPTNAAISFWIGKAYAKGAEAYETNPEAKSEIDEINKKIYERSEDKINEIYDWGLEVTMKAFEDIYDMLGTQFDFYFLESQVAGIGEEVVNANIGKVFEKSDGAVVFKAEKHDPKLHTRVFITSQGLPTYEAKEQIGR